MERKTGDEKEQGTAAEVRVLERFRESGDQYPNPLEMIDSILLNFNTAFRDSVGGAAGLLKTPAASHRPLPTLGDFRWVKFKLFVQYSFIIRSLFVHSRARRKVGFR